MNTHPYSEFEGTKLWATLSAALGDLRENQDLELTTPERYVVGYLAKKLTAEGLVSIRETAIPLADEKEK